MLSITGINRFYYIPGYLIPNRVDGIECSRSILSASNFGHSR